MCEHKIEPVEAIAREHGEVRIPISARVIPFFFESLVVNEIANAAHGYSRRLPCIAQPAIPADFIGCVKEAVHKAALVTRDELLPREPEALRRHGTWTD